MGKFVVTTALALVLAGGAYAQGHHGGMGGGGGGFGGGGGSAGPSGGMHSFGGGAGTGPSMMSRGSPGPSMMSRGSPSPSGFSSAGRMPRSSYNGPGTAQRGSQFSRNGQGPQGRTLYNSYNQERGNRALYNRYSDRDHVGDHDHGGRGNDHDMDSRHRGVVHGDYYEHGRHFHYRRFWNGAWVFLNGWDDCTAWMWVHVAPGVWAWRPVDVCFG